MIVASEDFSDGVGEVEASRSTGVSAQVVCCWVVISEHNIILEGKSTGRAAACIGAIHIKGSWGVRDDRIVRHQNRTAITEAQRDRILCAAKVARWAL